MDVPRSNLAICQTHCAEADEEGPVEPQALADLLDVRRGRLVAGDHGRRIAGRDVEQEEHEQQRTTGDHGNRREDASDYINEHEARLFMSARGGVGGAAAPGQRSNQRTLDTPQENGSGAGAMPVTLLRHAG